MTTDPSIWVEDPETGLPILVHYSELEDDVRDGLFFKPVGGFIFPADEFTLRPLPRAPFVIKDWLPKSGKALFYAPAKTGKSYFSLQIARSVGAGEPLLGLETSQGKSLYIQFELGEEILQRRMREETKMPYPNVWVGTNFSLKLDTPSGQRMLMDAVDAVQPTLLILDPLYKAINGDENEASDMMKVVNYLDDIITTFGCSIIVIHHSGKDESKRGRGSTVFEDWVDSYIQMKKKSKDGEPLRVHIKPIFMRHAPNPDTELEVTLGKDFEFHVTTNDNSVKSKVAELIKIKQTMTPKALFESKLGGNTAVYSALKELMAEGKVEKLGRGEYTWKT